MNFVSKENNKVFAEINLNVSVFLSNQKYWLNTLSTKAKIIETQLSFLRNPKYWLNSLSINAKVTET